MDVFTKFTNVFDAAVRNMHKTSTDQTQKCQKYYKMEFQTIGKAFQQLGSALEQDGNYCKLKSKNIYSKNLSLIESYFYIFSESELNKRNYVYWRGLRRYW